MDLYIADDLLTDDPEAALAASQGVVIGNRLNALEQALAALEGALIFATDADIDALFA